MTRRAFLHRLAVLAFASAAVPLRTAPAYASGRLDTIRILDPPRFVPLADETGQPTWMKASELRAEILSHGPTPRDFVATRGYYYVLRNDWFDAFVAWFTDTHARLGVTYTHATWDCKNFAKALVVFASVAAAKAGYTQQPLAIGWMTVKSEHAWAGAPAAGTHALVLVRTESGVHVVEPQNGRRTALASYPNRHLLRVVFFP